MKKIIAILFSVFFIALCACSEQVDFSDTQTQKSEVSDELSVAESSLAEWSHDVLSEPSDVASNEPSDIVSNESSKPADIYDTYGKRLVQLSEDRFLVEPERGQDLYLFIDKHGNVLNTREEMSIYPAGRSLHAFQTVLIASINDEELYLLDYDGNRIDDMTYNYIFDEYGITGGFYNGVFYMLDNNGKVTEVLKTDYVVLKETDGVALAAKCDIACCNNYGFLYGIMKDGEFIVEPKYFREPIISDGRIYCSYNAWDCCSTGYTVYNNSGEVIADGEGSLQFNFEYDFMILVVCPEESGRGVPLHTVYDMQFKKLYETETELSFYSEYTDGEYIYFPGYVKYGGEKVLQDQVT